MIIIIIFIIIFITFYIKDHYNIRMFNSIIIKLFYNMISLFITILSQDMFIAYVLFLYSYF